MNTLSLSNKGNTREGGKFVFLLFLFKRKFAGANGGGGYNLCVGRGTRLRPTGQLILGSAFSNGGELQ